MMDADASAFGVLQGAGRIDEVAVYNRALSDDEIRGLFELSDQVPAERHPSSEK
jgi:hypothetical protein